MVLIPERIYDVFQQREPGERVTRAQLEAMGYPRLPEDDELEEAYQEQHVAALALDAERLREAHLNVELLEQRAAQARRALEIWKGANPAELEERIAWELAEAPHGDVMLGIPQAALQQT